MILAIKYGDKLHFVNFFAKKIFQHLRKKNIEYSKYKLVYIPSSLRKICQRGYNQSLELCKALSRYTNQEVCYNLLTKHHYSSQRNSTKDQRFTNAANIIKDTSRSISDANKMEQSYYMVVDDVIGSGATMLRIANLFKKSNLLIVAIAKS